MFALGVELLMGRAVITRWDRRDRPEWPPHPDRVFMALVAAFGETGEDDEERRALEWLEEVVERHGPPALAVPDATAERTTFTSYVPVNDTADPMSKGKALAPMGSLPIGRNRQPRHFPAVVPDEPTFHLVWPDAELPPELREPLERVCRNVTYLGHSATPVRVGIAAEHGEITLAPTTGRGTHQLRTFGPGRLADLRDRHKFQIRPQPQQWTRYASPRPAPERVPDSLFDPGLIVLRQVSGRTFSLESAGMIAGALRDELMRRHGPGAPEWLTGHPPESTGQSRLHRPGIVPLGFVGREHADGHLLGVALALPSDFPPTDAGMLFNLLACHGEPEDVAAVGVGFVRLRVTGPIRDAAVGEMVLELDERPMEKRAYALRPETWTRPACLWATVTPVVLPRFTKKNLTAEQIVAQACVESGYPEPVRVETSSAPVVIGTPHVRSFRGPVRPGRPPRPLVHAAILFDGPVRGPMLIGAGRYLGMGLCRPLAEEETS